MDPEGRYIIIIASINNKLFTIANLYGPNNDDPSFYHTFFSQITNYTSNSITIIGGDFNTVLNPSSQSGKSRISQSSKVIKEYMDDFGLGDSWRLRNSTAREYSYFSAQYQSFSRIDIFLSSNSTTSNILDTKVSLIIISDHAPIILTLKNESPVTSHRTWRFNTSLLKDPEFDSLIREEWASFMEINDSPDISPTLLWETGKAVIRGKIISYSSHKKKLKQKLQNNLENKIKALTDDYANNPTEHIWNELQTLTFQLNNILTKKY